MIYFIPFLCNNHTNVHINQYIDTNKEIELGQICYNNKYISRIIEIKYSKFRVFVCLF